MSSPKRLLDALNTNMAPGDGGLSREQAQALSEKIVKMSKADAINVTINAGLNTNVRFAANQMSTAGSIVDATVVVQSAFGPKHAVVTTNDLSDEALKRTVEQAERLAKLAPDDPESMPELDPQKYIPVNAWFESTAGLTAGERAKAALSALEPARAAGDVTAAGFLIVFLLSAMRIG